MRQVASAEHTALAATATKRLQRDRSRHALSGHAPPRFFRKNARTAFVRTCTQRARRSSSFSIFSLHFLQDERPDLAYSALKSGELLVPSQASAAAEGGGNGAVAAGLCSEAMGTDVGAATGVLRGCFLEVWADAFDTSARSSPKADRQVPLPFVVHFFESGSTASHASACFFHLASVAAT